MPSIFLAHGNPMNAISKNAFTDDLKKLSLTIPQAPKAILGISAHWQTSGTRIHTGSRLKTIHDFSGFSEDLYKVQYPAQGDTDLAQKIIAHLASDKVQADEDWGLDHGLWSVLVHVYPKANIPVIPISLDKRKTITEHFNFAKKLKYLRDQGVMIVASGNIVHNLWMANLDDINGETFDWAKEFDTLVKDCLVKRDFNALIQLNRTHGSKEKLSAPTLEHYLPLIYAIACSDDTDKLQWVHEGFQNRSVSMLSVMFS